MKIYLEKEKKNIDMPFTGTGKELFKSLKINPATVLLVKNNEIVLVDEALTDKDEIRILSVISGG